MPSVAHQPVRLAVVNDSEVVVKGVASMLADHADRVVVVEYDIAAPVLSGVDIILCDTFAQAPGDGIDLTVLMASKDTKVVVFTWSGHPAAVALALEQGAVGYLSKSLTALELVEALEAIHAGETVTSSDVELGDAVVGHGDWPGRFAGLSPREAETLALIAKGLSNEEVAAATHRSINTIKSSIRITYRKIGVQNRAQAVVWALQHGFAPERTRVVDPGGADPENVTPS